MNPIVVKIRRLGARTEEVTLESGVTVGDALAAAGVSVEGSSIRINGETVGLGHVLTSDTTILLVPQVKGGAL